MPKKSEKTLAKEAAFKELIQKEWDALPTVIKPVVIAPSHGKIAKPVKGYTKLYAKTATFDARTTAILTKLPAVIQKYWQPLGLLMDPMQKLVILNKMHNLAAYSMWVSGKLVIGTFVATPYADIQTYVLNTPLTDFAAVCTWPDITGKAKMYLHEDSAYMPKASFNQFKTKHDGLNREALKDVEWGDVAKYIIGRNALMWHINQRAVCDLVKRVSKKLSDKAIQEAGGA